MSEDGFRDMSPQEAERLARFLEGGLDAAERERMLEELATSPDSLETVLVAAEVAAEVAADVGVDLGADIPIQAETASGESETPVLEISRWGRRSTWVGMGLVAAAVAAISLLPGETDLLVRALPTGAARSLADGWIDHAWTTLRAGSDAELPLDHAQLGFRAGVLVSDLEVASRDSVPSAHAAVLSQLQALLSGGEFIGIRAAFPTDPSVSGTALWIEVEAFFGEDASRGRGLEAIRLAALSGNSKFLSDPIVVSFARALSEDLSGETEAGPGAGPGPGVEAADLLGESLERTEPDVRAVLTTIDRLFSVLGG
jgi:hypothetical protein